MDYVALGIIWYVVFIISATFHEFCHGFAASRLGDPTACHYGLVTIDPVPHIKRSPFGMVGIPILSFLFSGWMIGLVVAWQLFGPVFSPIHTLALNILYPGAGYH
jgi:hypothetical protein